MEIICKKYIVNGRVQGVGFRYSTKHFALELGMKGSVCNLKNGNVEVQALGDEAQHQKLASWLKQGPPHARVENVECQDCEQQDFDGFNIL